MTRKLIIALAVVALAALGLAACGDDDETDTAEVQATTEETTTETGAAGGGGEGAGGGGGTIEVTADPGGALAYETGDLTVDAGQVEIAFDNPANIGHDVRIEAPDGTDLGGTDIISSDSTTATVEISEPGEYIYFCSVGGHRAAGMEQRLTVE